MNKLSLLRGASSWASEAEVLGEREWKKEVFD